MEDWCDSSTLYQSLHLNKRSTHMEQLWLVLGDSPLQLRKYSCLIVCTDWLDSPISISSARPYCCVSDIYIGQFLMVAAGLSVAALQLPFHDIPASCIKWVRQAQEIHKWLTVSCIFPSASRMKSRSQWLRIQDMQTDGFNTANISLNVFKKHFTLTHHNNVSTYAVHSAIIIVGQIQPRLDKVFQTRVFSDELLPSGHEHLEWWCGTR